MRIYLKQTDSTNRIAKKHAVAGVVSGTVVWARYQISGQGQHGRSFVSPEGGLYFSLVLNPNVPAADVPLVTIVTGLACRDVLSEYCQVETMIKWPNDVYLGGKKLGGILCENQLDTSRMPMVSTVIIGVGMNINSRLHDFPVDLHSTITTLYEHSQRTYDLPHLLDQCVTRIGDMVGALPVRRTEMLARWQQHDYLLNKPLRHIHGSEIVVGVGKGITEDGHYRFVDNGGQERTVLAGQLRPIGETF